MALISKMGIFGMTLVQGRLTRGQRGRGLIEPPPPTFWDLLNRSFSQIAQKRNKNLHEKSTPKSPLTFQMAPPL